MREVDELKRAAIAEVDRLADRLWEAAAWIGQNPEIAHQEHQAVARLADLLDIVGVDVETNAFGLRTAFAARVGPNRRPRVAILAAYDALPSVGHGNGLNLIGPAAVGAALALTSPIESLPGSVVVLGAPEEELTVDDGGLAHLDRAGALGAVDACLTFHPSQHTFVDPGAAPNSAIARAFRRNLEAIGLDVLDSRPEPGLGSIDFGIVSRRVPSAAAAISIAEPDVPYPSAAFAEAALSEKAHGALLAAAKGLAMTAIDLLADPSLLSKAQAEFDVGPGRPIGS
ncbi:MAG: hypothetical protein M3O34_10085 [Chloroflexota bacterium]|nr:hypothetical protein [Chloroflexota bacterium]